MSIKVIFIVMFSLHVLYVTDPEVILLTAKDTDLLQALKHTAVTRSTKYCFQFHLTIVIK